MPGTDAQVQIDTHHLSLQAINNVDVTTIHSNFNGTVVIQNNSTVYIITYDKTVISFGLSNYKFHFPEKEIPQVFTYVSGLNKRIANSIVRYREKIGKFKNRKEIMDVTGVGEKLFEQAAGFLRIRNSPNPLDKSAVHPESYFVVEKMASKMNCEITDLMTSIEIRKKINLNDLDINCW